jgi:dTDP-4-dehydrorhamnose 3,5-epimerase
MPGTPDCAAPTCLIKGIKRLSLTQHNDPRGSLTEFHRASWRVGPSPVQWNIVHSRPNVLRGIHVHVRHWDLLMVADGVMEIGLGDLRRGSPSFGVWEVVRLSGDSKELLVIPPGVAHGFYCRGAVTHLYGVSQYWNPAEEMGCHWSDPELPLAWSPGPDAILSCRDQALGSLKLLLHELEPYQDLWVSAP